MSYKSLLKTLRYLIKMLVSPLMRSLFVLTYFPIFVDPNNWEWGAKSKAIWEPADEKWQGFNTKWYGTTVDGDPKHPSLSLEPLPINLDTSISSSIVIRKSYLTMFDTVWAQAISSKGREGVIITGQPGIGVYLLSHIHYCVR